jgi:hypothetical protein
MKRFCIIIATALLLPSLAWAGPQITFEDTRHEFGTVETGTQLEHEFVLTNAGDEELLIKGLKPS